MKGNPVRIILIICEIIILGIMMGPLIVERWFNQGEISTWYGSLTQVTYDSEVIAGSQYVDLRNEACASYEEAKDYCDDIEEESYDYEDCPEDQLDLLEADCTRFKNLYAGGVIIILLSSVAMGVWVAKLIFLILLFWRKEKRLGRMVVVVLTVIIALFYLIGYGVWMGLSKTTFKDDCEDFYDGDKQQKVCADDGAKFGLFSVLFNIVYSALFVLAILLKWHQDEEHSSNLPAQNAEVEMRSNDLLKPPNDSNTRGKESLKASSNEALQYIGASPQVVSDRVEV